MRQGGFTLVEILIIVALVIILATMAAPNILRSRVNANEGTAVGNLRSINNACQLYHLNQDQYPEALADLSNTTPPYLDSTLASGEKQSYKFVYKLVSSDQFTVNANPISTGLLRGKYFYMDETGVIRYNSTGPADSGDEIVK